MVQNAIYPFFNDSFVYHYKIIHICSQIEVPKKNQSIVDSDRHSNGIYYKKPEELPEDWDPARANEFPKTSSSEKHNDFIRKGAVFLKCITILITTSAVLAGGVISKGLIIFMVSRVKQPTHSDR